MDNDVIQKKCEDFLKELGVPGFVVFGWQKEEGQFGVVSTFHQMPVNAAISLNLYPIAVIELDPRVAGQLNGKDNQRGRDPGQQIDLLAEKQPRKNNRQKRLQQLDLAHLHNAARA